MKASKAHMKLFQAPGCPYAHRARIVLREKSLPHEVVYFQPYQRPPELLQVSPDARSPTLFDNATDARVWDSLVVIEYLEEQYPEVPLMPRAAMDRAAVRLLMRDVETKLLSALGMCAKELVHKPPGTADPAIVRDGIARYREALIPWEERVSGREFVVGKRLTLADIVLFTPIASAIRLLGEEGEIPGSLPSLRTWCDRIAARPSTAY
jgi:RNA polymerase-associated protein